MPRIICNSCGAANYSNAQDRETCWNCRCVLIQRRSAPSFSANDVLEDIKHIAKEVMYDMDFEGMDKCDVIHRIAEELTEEYC